MLLGNKITVVRVSRQRLQKCKQKKADVEATTRTVIVNQATMITLINGKRKKDNDNNKEE